MLEDAYKNSYKDTIKENMGLSVYNTGFQRCEPGYTWGPAVRDHYLIHYVSSGKGRYSFDDKTFELSTGDLFLIYPSKVVCYSADEIFPWEYFWVGFNGNDADRLLGMTDFTRDHPVIHCDEKDTKYRSLLIRIYEQRGSQPSNDAEMTGDLYHFLAELIRLSSSQDRKHGYQKDYVKNVIRYIQCNYTEDLSIENLAGYIGISRSHLYRLFTEVVGISPKEYLTNFRINKACGLLRTSDMTITQISLSTGFKDPLYFTRVFKKTKGMTPSEIKRIS